MQNNKLGEADTIGSQDNLGILRQIDIWFGKRHRFWYFLSGFMIAVLAYWAFQRVVLNPINEKNFELTVNRYEKEVERLQNRLSVEQANFDYIDDSLKTLNSYGIYLGTHKIGENPEWPSPILGSMVQVHNVQNTDYKGIAILSLTIDTFITTQTGRNYIENPKIYTDIDVSLGSYSPLKIGGKTYYIYCSDIDSSQVTVDIYKALF